jgi:hypothetical protein
MWMRTRSDKEPDEQARKESCVEQSFTLNAVKRAQSGKP